MPRCATTRSGVAYGAAADRLGWGWGPVPFAINSVPRDGRAACVHCSQCLGHASPVDAKNGTHNTVIPRAVASGNCDLLVRAQVVEIVQRDGRGVRVIVGGAERTRALRPGRRVRGRGRDAATAAGLRPRHRRVGTNLHNHSFAMLYGTATTPLERFQGPGHSVATLDFVHRDGEAWGGGVLFDAPSLLPVAPRGSPASSGIRLGRGPQGLDARRPRHIVGGMGIGQEIPSARSRVTLDPDVRDVHGMPVARLHGAVHPATAEVRAYMAGQLDTGWTRSASSARMVFGSGRRPAAAGEHSAGTCRMGEDPATSACDRDGRLHGAENVYVADASLLPTNGSVNPCVTTMANAWRVAEGIGGG